SERELAREVAAARGQRGVQLLELRRVRGQSAYQEDLGALPRVRAGPFATRGAAVRTARATRCVGDRSREAAEGDSVREPPRLRSRDAREGDAALGRRCRLRRTGP